MDQHQIQLLTRMKGLIKEGKRKFKVRKDRNYLDDLLNLSLTVDEAWEEILTLNKNFYYLDPKHFYNQSQYSLTFKKNNKR